MLVNKNNLKQSKR